ncbi:MAG: hypothetical protein A2287_08160 [Candidatus Melainabacteria bacterium RIFOXYA12_FULL_32_12]|nr:MAG: hypothetical protein A2255_01950 [Candidatus Melainabacteria bacterium RIFOXYA2_FULL_32_9]OGI31762.1 MAG: hypothetical protein A2287_08160 [Candidatus Melainabacteria bacterium RIFOXYA12_FULL_32_12]
MRAKRDMDWKIFIKPYISSEEYKPYNIDSKRLNGFIFFIILGFITSFSLITKVEGKSDNYKTSNPAHFKIQKLKETINNVEISNAMIESEILLLNHSLAQMLESKEKQEILMLSRFTGTHKKIGPGIVIKLSDSDKPLELYENPNIGLIHNTDLLNLINDLWAAKAEAISLNNERITSRTGIRCVGPTILVNKTRIAPPFVIKAVGNPQELIKSAEKEHLPTFQVAGIKYSIEKYNKLEIPADNTIILAGDF